MSRREKWVRRLSVDELAKHTNGFTIYKITSVLFPIDSPEAMTIVSVWKRYSDVQQLHKSMRSLHAGLHLKGNFPTLAKHSYFKRFKQEVLEERANSIKVFLNFIAEHTLLFTSTDFVNFLQAGYPEPEEKCRISGPINSIRSALHLPIEETPPLEYQTSNDVNRQHHAISEAGTVVQPVSNNTFDELNSISQIPIYEAAEVEQSSSSKTEMRNEHKPPSQSNSFESINSLDSLDSDLYDQLNKVTIDKTRQVVKNKTVLPDLIFFETPSTSHYEDYITKHNTRQRDSETVSLNSTVCSASCDDRQGGSKISMYGKESCMSLSEVDSRIKTEDSYVFEAGYILNLAARCEDLGDYHKAFECYKSGIEKMMIGVQSDTDAQRRALVKKKIDKYIVHAESIHKDHLCHPERGLLPDDEESISRAVHCPLPISMLHHPYEDLALYRVIAILDNNIMLVLRKDDQTYYAMKVLRKIPNNLTEFDEYFLQNTNETRQPILPTNIPYMVPLSSYIETNNLIFLILRYAPGDKLFDYIKNYIKSKPSTSAREVNLENVFTEPMKTKNVDNSNVNIDVTDKYSTSSKENVDDSVEEVDAGFYDSVRDLVKNSQQLLENVDKILNDSVRSDCKILNDNDVEHSDSLNLTTKLNNEEDNSENDKIERCVDSPNSLRLMPRPKDVLPPTTICKWGAEILTALESLHNCGVVCRDLNPSNILLGSEGHIILTYMYGYHGLDMCLAKIRTKPGANMYIAPELYRNVFVENEVETLNGVCDFWSYGALMYELLCGVPLSYYNCGVFTSHTVLQLPQGLSLEEESLLTQLLTFAPSERLGAGKDGISEIKNHPYFKNIDWQHVYNSWTAPD